MIPDDPANRWLLIAMVIFVPTCWWLAWHGWLDWVFVWDNTK